MMHHQHLHQHPDQPPDEHPEQGLENMPIRMAGSAIGMGVYQPCVWAVLQDLCMACSWLVEEVDGAS